MTTSASRITRGPRRTTTAEYLALPTDDERSELVYGEIVMSPRPTDEHNDLLHDLVEIVKRWVRHQNLGKVSFDIDMVLDARKGLVYAPDFLFVARGNEGRRKKGRVYGAADLCGEIHSPSDRPWIRNRKFADYERYGVRWFWIISPGPGAPGLSEFELDEGKYVCRAEVTGDEWFEPGLFPGLVFRLPPLIAGEELKAAVKGAAKKLM
jgi:Uma2 family endonuclease